MGMQHHGKRSSEAYLVILWREMENEVLSHKRYNGYWNEKWSNV